MDESDIPKSESENKNKHDIWSALGAAVATASEILFTRFCSAVSVIFSVSWPLCAIFKRTASAGRPLLFEGPLELLPFLLAFPWAPC